LSFSRKTEHGDGVVPPEGAIFGIFSMAIGIRPLSGSHLVIQQATFYILEDSNE